MSSGPVSLPALQGGGHIICALDGCIGFPMVENRMVTNRRDKKLWFFVEIGAWPAYSNFRFNFKIFFFSCLASAK